MGFHKPPCGVHIQSSPWESYVDNRHQAMLSSAKGILGRESRSSKKDLKPLPPNTPPEVELQKPLKNDATGTFPIGEGTVTFQGRAVKLRKGKYMLQKVTPGV